MADTPLARETEAIVRCTPGTERTFLEGPPGCGKTTLAVRRMLYLLQNYVPAETVLVLVPQRALGQPYRQALWELDMPGGEVTVVTVGGLARRAIELFWPVFAAEAGFGTPTREPTFLTLETTQYYMDRIVGPHLETGAFDGLTIHRNRLVSQIIDNLNKGAVVGFPHTEVADRLKDAWAGESARLRVYDQVQACVNGFRAFCLEHNLLDFSLQYEVFFGHVLAQPVCRSRLIDRYRHLIVDNVEEDTPRAHDLLRDWLASCDSALLVMDRDGGYRAFLGADAEGAADLKSLCQHWFLLDRSYVMSPPVQALSEHVMQAVGIDGARAPSRRPRPSSRPDAAPRSALHYRMLRFQPEMYEWVADEVATLTTDQGIEPDQIAILAPFLGDAMRFSLSEALARRGIPARSHRPSRALRDEPAARCLFTLAAMAHPAWEIVPAVDDVAQAWMMAIAGLDLVRARLLTEITYRPREGRPKLTSFDRIRADVQERIGYRFGERFEELRNWLEGCAVGVSRELDDWIGQLFVGYLSRPGFGFHRDLDAGRVAANLIESIGKFRRAVGDTLPDADERYSPLSREYVRMVERGIIAATYVSNWQLEASGAVLMAPAYTFLVANRAVDVQFWLDVGSSAWWERLYQPLTHPYVLSRRWRAGKAWTDEDEYAVRQAALARLALGLVRRCRRAIYLGIAELGEQGIEQRGPLLQTVQRVLRRLNDRP